MLYPSSFFFFEHLNKYFKIVFCPPLLEIRSINFDAINHIIFLELYEKELSEHKDEK